MAKQVKCKKCNLTYDKKKYECPYCHKKRFNPTGLIIFLIIVIIAAGAAYYFFGDKIAEYIKENANDITTNQNGLVFKSLSIEESEENDNTYIINFDVINNTGNSFDKTYMLINLADKVRAPVTEGRYISWENDYEILNLQMVSEEIYKAEYKIKIENEWNELEIFLREIAIDEPEEMKIFSFKNNFEKRESETTTDINIITE